jgi:hypothetical protein
VVDVSSGSGTAEISDSYALNPIVEHITIGTVTDHRARVIGLISGAVVHTNLYSLDTMEIGQRQLEEDTLFYLSGPVGAPLEQENGLPFTPTSNLSAYSGFDYAYTPWVIDTSYSPYPVFQWQVAEGIHP